MIRTTLLALCLSAFALHANDLAVVEVKFPGEKPKKFTIELFNEDAPRTVENFEKLARKKFYKGVTFHRAFPKKMVQTGDPLSKKKHTSMAVGTGGPGYTVPAEIKRKHVAGAVAMGRLPDKINPNKSSNGSQFYIALVPMPKLDGGYTVFGQVVDGMDVLTAISSEPTDSNDAPERRIVIRSVKITKQ